MNASLQSFTKHLRQTPQPFFTCSKLTIETLEQGVKYVIVDFEHILHLLVFLLLTLNMQLPAG